MFADADRASFFVASAQTFHEGRIVGLLTVHVPAGAGDDRRLDRMLAAAGRACREILASQRRHAGGR